MRVGAQSLRGHAQSLRVDAQSLRGRANSMRVSTQSLRGRANSMRVDAQSLRGHVQLISRAEIDGISLKLLLGGGLRAASP
jgi:hypothetical protein